MPDSTKPDKPEEIIAEAIAQNSGRCLKNCPPLLQDSYRAEADNIIAALHAAGFKIMPREPTERMRNNTGLSEASAVEDTYRAMWDAAP